jgi:hypothetical protein
MSIEIPTRKDKAVQNHVLRSQKNAGRAEDWEREKKGRMLPEGKSKLRETPR